MRLTSNSTFKIKGSDPLSRKKAKNFFDYKKVWDDKELFETRSELQKNLPPRRGYSDQHYLGEALEMLEKAGFIKIVDTETWDMSYDHAAKRYLLWAHPSGVLCSASTYNYKPNEPVDHQQLNDMHMYTHLNVGFSGAGYCGTVLLSSASGGGHMSKTGEAHIRRHKSISSSSDFVRELIDIQSAGRIVPFHEQNLNEVSMYLSAQQLIPASQWKDSFSDITATLTKSEMFEHFKTHKDYYAECFWGNLFEMAKTANAAIPALGDVFAVSMYHCASTTSVDEKDQSRALFYQGIAQSAAKYGVSENIKDARADHTGHWLGPHLNEKTILHYMYVEAASNFLGRIQEHTQQRYNTPEDIQLIEQWMHELKHHKTGVNWNNIDTTRTTSDGVSVVHLCLAMDSAVYTHHQKGGVVSLAQQAIEHTPVSVLTQLCTTPLPDGNTLPLMAVEQYLRMRMEYHAHERVLNEKFEDIMHVLHKKVPAHQWNCGSQDTNTLDGVWLHALHLSHFKNSNPYPKKELEKLLEPWRTWGCQFPSHTTISFPLRRSRENEARIEFLCASKIANTSLEDAFARMMDEEKPKEEIRQKMLNTILKEVVSEGVSLTKRKM